jgi:hypothetical protein
MKCPYDDGRMVIDDIARERGTSVACVRILIRQLEIKPIERFNNVCIYSGEDALRLINHHGKVGRPAMMSVWDIVAEAASKSPSVTVFLGCQDAPLKSHAILDAIESSLMAKWPTSHRKLRTVLSKRADGRPYTTEDNRPAWPSARKAEFVEFILAFLAK